MIVASVDARWLFAPQRSLLGGVMTKSIQFVIIRSRLGSSSYVYSKLSWHSKMLMYNVIENV